jgi:hypothetical protein
MVTKKVRFEPSELMLTQRLWDEMIVALRRDNLLDQELIDWLYLLDATWAKIEKGFDTGRKDDYGPPEERDERQRASVAKLQIAFRYSFYMGWSMRRDYELQKTAANKEADNACKIDQDQ